MKGFCLPLTMMLTNPGEKPFPGKEICSRCYRADGFKEMAKGCARVSLLKYTDYRVITLLFGSQ